MTNEKNETFEAALARFLATTQAFLDAEYARKYKNLRSDELVVDAQPASAKTVRVISRRRDSTGRQVFCFVDRATGDVLKAASWKVPAKHARGSIYAEEFSGYGVTMYGAKYLK